MNGNTIDYHISGHDMQAVEVTLDPGESMVAEAGSLAWMEDGIEYKTVLGDGSNAHAGPIGKIAGGLKRILGGESFLMAKFENSDIASRKVAFAASHPGHILPINLEERGGKLFCQKDAFLCAPFGTEVGIALNKKLGAGFFGGEGFILQKLTGLDTVFLHAGGTLVHKRLENERLVVDTGCLVAFDQGIEYSIKRSGNLKTMVFGREGFFHATLRGTGDVYLQTLPFARMVNKILRAGRKAPT